MNDYEEFDPENDPNRKQFLALKEQMEFWREQFYNEDATPEQHAHAEQKLEELMGRAIEALQRFNKRCEEAFGPLPLHEIDEATLKELRQKFAEDGMEVTLDEIKEALEEDNDTDSW